MTYYLGEQDPLLFLETSDRKNKEMNEKNEASFHCKCQMLLCLPYVAFVIKILPLRPPPATINNVLEFVLISAALGS